MQVQNLCIPTGKKNIFSNENKINQKIIDDIEEDETLIPWKNKSRLKDEPFKPIVLIKFI